MHSRHLIRHALSAAKACQSSGSSACATELRFLQRQLATVAPAESSTPASCAEVLSGAGNSSNSGRVWLFAPFALAAAGCSVAVAGAQQAEVGPADAAKSVVLGNSAWLQQLAQQEDMVQALTAESLQNHPLLKSDHLFSVMLQNGSIADMVCYYDQRQREFHTVMQLGRNVCGFPTIVHGGLTAAVIDETLGFLLFALKKQRQLPFWGPAYTAHLEVNYKAKIPAGSTILCTSRVESCEGRKLWMVAEVKDGPSGKVYATARALFVAPKPQRLLKDAYRYVLDGVLLPNRIGSM